MEGDKPLSGVETYDLIRIGSNPFDSFAVAETQKIKILDIFWQKREVEVGIFHKIGGWINKKAPTRVGRRQSCGDI